jgi:hypothetical protein
MPTSFVLWVTAIVVIGAVVAIAIGLGIYSLAPRDTGRPPTPPDDQASD